MYQAWVVQDFGGTPCNVVIGREFKTIEEAYRAIHLYEYYLGSCKREVVEPSGTEIPTVPRKTVFQKIKEYFRG